MVSVTVVTVTYNAETEIEKTLESVLCQEYPYIKYIIMDGGSVDGTIDIIRGYKTLFDKKKIDIRIISENDSGIYNAMNKSMQYVSSDYVLFLNAGDYFFDSATLARVFKNQEEVKYDIIYGDYYLYYEQYRKYVKSLPYNMLNKRMISTHQAFFIKTSLLKERPYNEKYKMVADYDFFLDMYNKGKTYKHIDAPIVYFKTDGVSQKRWYITQTEVMDIQKKYGCVSKYELIMNKVRMFLQGVKKTIIRCLPVRLRYIRYEAFDDAE